MHPIDARIITNAVLPPQNAAAFYSAPQKTIFVRNDQVFIQVIAHEMCHAYTSRQWNEFQTAFLAFGELRMNNLDEAVTSEVANVVLYAWHRARTGRTGGVPPDGYVGYGKKVRDQGAHHLSTVDRTVSTIGPASLQAYLGGAVAFHLVARPRRGSKVAVDPASVLESRVTLGSKPRRVLTLKELLV